MYIRIPLTFHKQSERAKVRYSKTSNRLSSNFEKWIAYGKLRSFTLHGQKISLRRPLPTFELERLNLKNNPFNWATSGFTTLVCCFDCGVLYWYSPWRSMSGCSFHAREANSEVSWKFISLDAAKSASIVWVISPKECNLFENSMFLSSPILFSLLMLQRSCNLTQTFFITWLQTCTKPRCHFVRNQRNCCLFDQCSLQSHGFHYNFDFQRLRVSSSFLVF